MIDITVKTGDKLIATEDFGYISKGRAYTAIRPGIIDGNEEMVRVVCDDGEEGWFRLTRFRHVPTSFGPMRAGDIVRCVKKNCNTHISVGTEYDVIRRGNAGIVIRNDGGFIYDYEMSLFEKVADGPESVADSTPTVFNPESPRNILAEKILLADVAAIALDSGDPSVRTERAYRLAEAFITRGSSNE